VAPQALADTSVDQTRSALPTEKPQRAGPAAAPWSGPETHL